MNFLFHILLAELTIIEKKTDFGFEDTSNVNTSIFKRAFKKDDHIELRSSADGGSLITFKDPNPLDNWSLEFYLNFLHLSFPQKAGFYLWYTDHEMIDGPFNGANGKFNGLMVGLEFLGKSLFLVLSTNDNEFDYSHVEDHNITTAVDTINPDRFRGVFNIRFKIISTDKNLRVELYDGGGNLLYDNFRFLNLVELGDLKKGKHFSITTTYDKTPFNHFFTLSKMILYDRIEGEEYDPYKIFSKTPDEKARWAHHIEHPNKEVRHLIANIENFIRYMKGHIGQPSNITIFKGIFDLHYELELFGKKIKELNEFVKEREFMPNDRLENLNKKIDTFKSTIGYIESSIDEIEHFLRVFEEKHERRISHVVIIIGIGVVLLGIFAVIRNYLISNRKKLKD